MPKIGVNGDCDCEECESVAADFLLLESNPKDISKEDKYNTTIFVGEPSKRAMIIFRKKKSSPRYDIFPEQGFREGKSKHIPQVPRSSTFLAKGNQRQGIAIFRKWKSSYRPFKVENSIKIPWKFQSSSRRHFD